MKGLLLQIIKFLDESKKMGNALCCANNTDGLADASNLLNEKTPVLFGTKIGLNDSDESSEEDHPLEGK